MDQFDIWGQIQEVSAGRLLVIATACPVESGRQTLMSAVVSDREVAVATLDRLIEQLREQLAQAGGAIVGVNRIPLDGGFGTPRARSGGAGRPS